mmetsp:Transcript_13355/g.20248  ORF Transcript_13355/g.20248 Transcript_13355/m.20248 type:complete len:387 (-) Transcript_13355:41-1201(-)
MFAFSRSFAPRAASRLFPSTKYSLVTASASASVEPEASFRCLSTTSSPPNNPISIKGARIISLSDRKDDANSPLHKGRLPDGAFLEAIGSSVEDFDIEALQAQGPNVIFVSHPQARKPLGELLQLLPTVEWVHTRSAGIDFVTSDELKESNVVVTNAKGQFSSTLAEYAMMACSYFAKDLPRLMRQKKGKEWGKYNVLELRGATLGVVGYGDIGRACAKLAKVYGMRVVTLRRNPSLSIGDPFCDVAYGSDQNSLNRLMRESDYILVSAPLTDETRGLIGPEAFQNAKDDAVFINLGRGPVVDENALIKTLKSGKMKGAALDVFTTEPLPQDSELWDLDNVLVSPHNMDQTATFMHEATEFFVRVNLPRFIRGEQLLNHVDTRLGY